MNYQIQRWNYVLKRNRKDDCLYCGDSFLEPGDKVYRCLYGEVVRIRDSKVSSMPFFSGAEDMEVEL